MADLVVHQPADPGHGWSPTPRDDDPYLDTEQLQRRLEARNKQWGGLRVHVGAFRCPWPLTRRHYEEFRNKAFEAWIHVMETKGWTLKSKVHVTGPFAAYGTTGDWYGVPLLDQREFRAKAAFLMPNFKPQRLELPVKVIKEA